METPPKREFLEVDPAIKPEVVAAAAEHGMAQKQFTSLLLAHGLEGLRSKTIAIIAPAVTIQPTATTKP